MTNIGYLILLIASYYIRPDEVRSEIKLGMGTQFAPRFARVMLQMIDEDKSYTMREK